jgi:hypothetical protein
MPGEYTPLTFAALLRKKADEIPFEMAEAVDKIVTAIAAELAVRSPRSSGRLAASQAHDTMLIDAQRAQGIAGTLRTAPEGLYLRAGTGLFGDRKHVIRSHRGPLRLTASGGTIFRAFQRGTPKNPYFDHTVREMDSSFVPIELKRLGEDVADLEL